MNPDKFLAEAYNLGFDRGRNFAELASNADEALEAEQNARQYEDFTWIARYINSFDNGGYFVVVDWEMFGPFDSEQEAREFAEANDFHEHTIELFPSADEAWEEFEQGIANGIDEVFHA